MDRIVWKDMNDERKNASWFDLQTSGHEVNSDMKGVKDSNRKTVKRKWKRKSFVTVGEIWLVPCLANIHLEGYTL